MPPFRRLTFVLMSPYAGAWQWASDWTVVKEGSEEDEGWHYATNFGMGLCNWQVLLRKGEKKVASFSAPQRDLMLLNVPRVAKIRTIFLGARGIRVQRVARHSFAVVSGSVSWRYPCAQRTPCLVCKVYRFELTRPLRSACSTGV